MLKLSQRDFDAIRLHGEETYPHECCGILLGTAEGERREVKQTVRAGNTRSDRPSDRYNIAPEELIRAQRMAREQALDIIGFYHSHPDCPAEWSLTDLAEAHWLGCSYVITSVEQGKAARTNSFALLGASEEEKHFENERLEVAPTAIAAMARVSEAPSAGPQSDRMPHPERMRKHRAC
jgi:proteasome lid subunit RPN8/RPN11